MARKYVLQRGLDHRVNWSSELEMPDRMADERNKKLLEHSASVRWVRSSDAGSNFPLDRPEFPIYVDARGREHGESND